MCVSSTSSKPLGETHLAGMVEPVGLEGLAMRNSPVEPLVEGNNLEDEKR